MKSLVILFSLLPLLIFGQQKAVTNSPFAVDLVFSPDAYAPPQVAADAGFYQESAYRAGVNVVSDLADNSRWSFRSGLRYVVYNRRIEGFHFDSSGLKTSISHEKITYFDVPLFFRYSVGKKKLKFYAELGGGLDFATDVIQKKIRTYWGLSLGLEYRFHSRFSIFAQPTFRKPSPRSNIYFFSTGIETGIKFRLPEY